MSDSDIENMGFLDTDNLPGISDQSLDIPEIEITNVPALTGMDDLRQAELDDLNLSRGTLRAQQEIMLQLAKSYSKEVIASEHPKVMEAFTKLMSEMTTNAKVLTEIYKPIKDSGPNHQGSTVGNQQINADSIFIGTSSDILDVLGTRQDTNSGGCKSVLDQYRATE